MSETKEHTIKKWVLVVDDESDIRDLVTRCLEMNFGENIKVLQAADGVDASGRLSFQAFDCIITDLKMPRREGKAFIKTVKQSLMNENTPIIVVTALPDPSISEEYEYIEQIQKPVRMAKLSSSVEKQLKLGPTDQRIAASFLNSFISSIEDFMNKTLEVSCEQFPPVAKKPREDFKGDFLQIIHFKCGKIKSKFVLGFPEGILKELHKKTIKTQVEPNYLKLTDAAGGVTFKYAAHHLGNKKLSLIENHSLKNSPDNQEVKNLTKEKGLLIPIKTSFGEIGIHALW